MPDTPSDDLTARLAQLQKRQLSVLQGAEILRLLGSVPPADSLCQSLAGKLTAQLTVEWIAYGELDEVFACLDALHFYHDNHGRSWSVSGQLLSAIAKRLLACEAAVGGPYRDDQGRIRPAANAYIAACLSWLAAPLPKLEAYLRQALSNPPPDTYTWVILARAYPQIAKQAVSTVYGPARRQPIRQIVQLIGVYIGMQPPQASNYAIGAIDQLRPPQSDDPRLGALYIAAKYRPKIVVETTQSGPAVQSAAGLNAVIKTARSAYRPLPKPLREQALRLFDHLLSADASHEITLLAHFFANAYPSSAAANDKLLQRLGAANVHSWLAYSVYDDFLDDEGQPAMLPVANVALRAAVDGFRQALPHNHAFQQYVHEAFTAVDAANSWELQYWRLQVSPHYITLGNLPDFADRQRLADRALLHIVGPAAILAAGGQQPHSQHWQTIMGGLRHYLIARQLTDDLHDWVEDLRAGHTSYIVAEILRSLALTPGTYRIDDMLAIARERFWHHLLPELCGTIHFHTGQARHNLQPYLQLNGNMLGSFINTLEASLQVALAERQRSQDFLRGL